MDNYNKDNISEDNKNIKNIQNSQKNEKNNKKEKDVDNKYTADKETMLLPYFIGGEKKEKKNEDTTKDCLTINKLLIHPFYSEINLTESFLKYLFKTESINKDEQENNNY